MSKTMKDLLDEMVQESVREFTGRVQKKVSMMSYLAELAERDIEAVARRQAMRAARIRK